MRRKRKKIINAKKILILIFILIGLIIEIKAFRDSLADKIIDVTINVSDSTNLLQSEKIVLQASNNNNLGYAVVLPEYISNKKISKYFVEQKNIADENSTENINGTTETEKKIVEKKAGEKLYLTQSEIDNNFAEINVEYDTVMQDSKTLYNKKLILKHEEDTVLSILGYMPADTRLEADKNDFSDYKDEILNNYSGFNLIDSYKLKLILDNNEEYIPKDNKQIVKVEILINQNLKYNILELQNKKLQQIKDIEIDGDKIRFETDELKTYFILEEKQKEQIMPISEGESDLQSDDGILNDEIELLADTINTENSKLIINDYETDKNYYSGLNYTENDSRTNTKKYTKNNLKKVTINYYGYDYNLTEFTKQEKHTVSLSATAQRTTTGNVTSENSGRRRYYSRTDTITVTLSGLNELRNKYPDLDTYKSWTLKLAVPNSYYFSSYFNADNTNNANSSNGKSVSVSDNVITVSGSDVTMYDNNSNQCTFTFYLSFKGTNQNNLNSISYSTLTANSFMQLITVGEYTPYGTISDIEEQMIVSYEKCVPVDENGKIKIELIDNPFTNRPIGRGFNGWKTNNTKYSNNITTNSYTYVQTLETSLNNIKNTSGEYVIDLYANWVEANVVFVSSSGNNSNSGDSESSPISNNWSTINSKLNANKKTATKASSREVNIVVLMNGTLDGSGVTGPNTPYTLTSLYDGINYGSTSTYLNVGTTNIILDSDIQFDNLYVSSDSNYSYTGTSDGTSSVSPCIYANMYNLRIGRGMKPVNSSYCTFAQVQGGYYNRSSSEFKVVVESGQYVTMQLYRAGTIKTGTSNSVTANGYLVCGSDIDRIKNNNDLMKVYNRCASKTTTSTNTPYTTNDSSALAINMNIKSGTYGVDYFNSQSTNDNSERNYAGIYVGGHGQTGHDKSDRKIIVEGGNIANIIGGLNVDSGDNYKTYIYVKNGNVINITGGAGYTHTYGNRIIQVTGGCIKYSISGGSNGVAANSDSNNGHLTGKTLIYIGGDAQIGATYTIESNGTKQITQTDQSEILYGVNAGCVCGGANGNNNYAGQTDGSYIIIDGDAIVHNNVYGGGNYGIIGSNDSSSKYDLISLKDETSSFQEGKEYLITSSSSGENGVTSNGTNLGNERISTKSIPSDSAKWIFENSGENSKYYIKNASTGQYIYVTATNSGWWGTTINTSLSSTNKTAFTVQGTNSKTILYQYTTTSYWGDNETKNYYLYYSNGWSFQESYYENNSVYLLTYNKIEILESEDEDTLVNIKVVGGNVKNNIYGGANRNDINGTVDIDMDYGRIDGIIYGGSNIQGTIKGSVLMDISGGQLGRKSDDVTYDYINVDTVFGGGLGVSTDVKGRVLLNIKDTSNDLNIYGNIYGGSSLGTITGSVELNLQDLPSVQNKLDISGYVFGGGKGNDTTAAIVNGKINVNVNGCDLDKCSVYGGSNINGTNNDVITVKVGETYLSNLYSIYGGGNQADITTDTKGVYVYLLANANIINGFNGGKAADLLSNGTDDKTRGIYLQGGTIKNMYGGSDSSGTVTSSNVYIESGNAVNVYGGNNQGGTVENSNVYETSLKNGSVVQNVYGGNNQGGITQKANITISGDSVYNVYGGGNQAITESTNIKINGNVKKYVFGGGNQAGINTNTNIYLENATVEDNVYGGGNEGTVTGNTYIYVKDSVLKNSLYAGGNGSSAIVFGNTNLYMHGKKNNIMNNVFGGGNKAATGKEESNSSKSNVNIVGGVIGKNVYGGANTSVVYGTTQTNIGYDAVNDTSLEIGDIEIGGTVFGGGEANESGSDVYDFSFISVTKGIDIQINGNGYNKFSILGSIFGSGNASSTSGESYITIKNYGTSDNPQNNVSIQRANCATIINSSISLSGATDRTNEYSSVFFSLSRVDKVKLKDNSILYLCNGTNLLKELDSVVDVDGVEKKGAVTIDPETGENTKNVDNRIYMLEGKNLNIATNEQVTAYGKVQGMFFFGLFTNRKNPSTSTGFYHKGYNNNDKITNAGTFILNSYAMGQHMENHDITVDGFYTNYNKDGIVKVDYVDTTPKDDVYYIWLVGEKMDVTVFEMSLTASKYATLGTYELLLKGFSDPNIKFSIAGFSSGLDSDVSLVEPSEIKSIEENEEKANSVFGLTMKTGNVGWKTKGSTSFLTQDGGKYIGINDYDADNSTYTPTFNFCFYHSQNITQKRALGDVKIRLQVLTPVDDLNYKLSYIDINITLTCALYQNDFFEAAITPGQEYGLFTSTETLITSKSCFSTYFSLYVEDFNESKYYENYKNYKRVLVSRDSAQKPYCFPVNTKLTMLDMVTNKYYYYIVTEDDVKNNKYEYNLSDFTQMGSSDSVFDEPEACNQYYNQEKNLIYENYIFHINFVDTKITKDIVENTLLMELQDQEEQTLIGVLGIQRDIMKYTVYTGNDATIKLNANINPTILYLGKTANLNVKTEFMQNIINSKTVYDTQYFDKKLGIKISIYDNENNRINIDSLLGVYFELDGKKYYPRIDGTTRICIADKVTDILAKLKINTQNNTTWATGDYKIKIESFGSSDGIYYGLTASDQMELDLKVINSSYGLKVTTEDKMKIVDKDTGHTLNGNNNFIAKIEYSSVLKNPNIAVSLYRRKYDEVFSQEYELVDLKDYLQDTLISTTRDKEYVVSSNPKTENNYSVILKEKLKSGTYKLVFKLYDNNAYVGEEYEYIIIK